MKNLNNKKKIFGVLAFLLSILFIIFLGRTFDSSKHAQTISDHNIKTTTKYLGNSPNAEIVEDVLDTLPKNLLITGHTESVSANGEVLSLSIQYKELEKTTMVYDSCILLSCFESLDDILFMQKDKMISINRSKLEEYVKVSLNNKLLSDEKNWEKLRETIVTADADHIDDILGIAS